MCPRPQKSAAGLPGWGSLNALHMTSAWEDPVQRCSFGCIPLPYTGLGSGNRNRQLWFPTTPCARHQCTAQLSSRGNSPRLLLGSSLKLCMLLQRQAGVSGESRAWPNWAGVLRAGQAERPLPGPSLSPTEATSSGKHFSTALG